MNITRERQRYILHYLLENAKLALEGSPYAKAPGYGHTGLYFFHPGYQHADYNKWRACDIEGNEAFCELVIQLWNELTAEV